MHKIFIYPLTFILFFAVFCSVADSATEYVNVCCYSNSPDDYEPKCYTCVNDNYKYALLACVNTTELPKNITYKQAKCLEGNCKVQLPKVEQPQSTEKLQQSIQKFVQDFLSPFLPITPKFKRSVDDNTLDTKSNEGVNIVEHVVTFVSAPEPPKMELGDIEYM